MLTPELSQRILVAAVAVLAGFVYTRSARNCCGSSATARYAVGAFTLATAALVALSIVAPVIGYALTCLSMVSVYVVDLVQEERARRRRVASLVPRPRVDLVLSIWIAVSGMSAAMLIPYLFEASNRVGGSIVAICTAAMATIAWRIASAPFQLLSDDPEVERDSDRASRARRTGITSILAVGIVFVFSSFVNQSSAATTPIESSVNSLSLFVWVALWVWEALYVRRLDRLHAKSS